MRDEEGRTRVESTHDCFQPSLRDKTQVSAPYLPTTAPPKNLTLPSLDNQTGRKKALSRSLTHLKHSHSLLHSDLRVPSVIRRSDRREDGDVDSEGTFSESLSGSDSCTESFWSWLG